MKHRSVCPARPLFEACHSKVTGHNAPQAPCQVATAMLAAEESEPRAKDIHLVGLRKRTSLLLLLTHWCGAGVRQSSFKSIFLPIFIIQAVVLVEKPLERDP